MRLNWDEKATAFDNKSYFFAGTIEAEQFNGKMHAFKRVRIKSQL